MAEDKEGLPKEETSKDSEDLLEHIQMQVSGIPTSAIPKAHRLRPGDIEAGVQRFLLEHGHELDQKK